MSTPEPVSTQRHASTAPAAPPTGTRIGRYAVQQVIGTGAFATVYRALDERLGATVAVKLLADNHCLDPDIRARFIDEGRVLRRIDSPHVVRVYDVGETDRMQPFLVLELADRGTLAQRVAAARAGGWRPTGADVLRVAGDLAAAVSAVHGAALVHRDLSPGNLLLRSGSPPRPEGALLHPDERVQVADLGLSKDLARSSGLTVAGGTDGFRPPEQREGPARVDGRADLWALSAVLFWLVTGEPPATEGKTAAAAGATLDQVLPSLGLPQGLKKPLLNGLHDDPAKRPADVTTWLAAIEAALAPPAPPPARPAKPAAPAAASAAAGKRRGRLVAAALVVAGVVAGAAGMWLADPGDGTGQTEHRRDDGQLEVTDRAGDARISLVGPDRADVGEPVTFTAATDGVDHWAWLMPDGAVYADRDTVQLSASSAGLARVRLVAVADTGERLEVDHELRLSEP